MKFFSCYKIWRFITIFTRACDWPLSSQLCLGLLSSLIPTKTLYPILFSTLHVSWAARCYAHFLHLLHHFGTLLVCVPPLMETRNAFLWGREGDRSWKTISDWNKCLPEEVVCSNVMCRMGGTPTPSPCLVAWTCQQLGVHAPRLLVLEDVLASRGMFVTG